MRFPNFTELDKEQIRIYQGAPPDGTVLIVGPPGTGKTVMAFHRATYLQRRGQRPRVIVYNRVLAAYTRSGANTSGSIPTSTMFNWVGDWWARMGAGRELPKIVPGTYWDLDWTTILTKVLTLVKDHPVHAAHWGHLIVDEGQDFPSDMYYALAMVIRTGNFPAGTGRPALTVFADENQRLNEAHNSTLDQIAGALELAGSDRIYHLKQNHRNTKEIAAFAAHFYCGLSSGLPDPPTRRGRRPTVTFATDLSHAIRHICAHVRGQPEHEVGVICTGDKVRNIVYNGLLAGLKGVGGVKVQSYSSGDSALNDTTTLQFDTPGAVTILNYQSVKGLEFDTVFVVDPLLAAGAAGSGQQQFKMNLYVMCSRARDILDLVFVSPEALAMPYLPDPSTYILGRAQ